MAKDSAGVQNPVVLPTRAGYDRWAAIYDRDGNPLLALEAEHVARLLGPVRGLRIADIGCGTGRHALRLAVAEAVVTAVDFSTGMLGEARGKPGAEGVAFLRADIAQQLPFRDASFDRVICCLVVEHIANLDALFGELRRICRADGFAVVSAMHPAMMLRGIQARFIDPDTGADTRPQSYPNQIADYVMAAVRAGLQLDHISEHAVDTAWAARFPRAEKYLGWPMLLMMRLHCRDVLPSRNDS